MNKKTVIILTIVGVLIVSGLVFGGIAIYNRIKDNAEEIRDLKDEIEKGKEDENEYVENTSVEVPDVSGMTVAKATIKLQEAGFEVSDEIMTVKDDSVEEGLVVKTIPSANTKRAKGAKVTIYVSSREDTITVENYTGKNYLQVKGVLEEYGIYVYVEKKDVNDPGKYAAGEVIDQSVKAGMVLKPKDSITLYIPRIDEKYPDFTKYKLEDVKKFCDEHNVQLTIEEVGTSSYSEGTIFYQSRAAGSVVTSGTQLTIKVAVKGDKKISNGDSNGCDETELC